MDTIGRFPEEPRAEFDMALLGRGDCPCLAPVPGAEKRSGGARGSSPSTPRLISDMVRW